MRVKISKLPSAESVFDTDDPGKASGILTPEQPEQNPFLLMTRLLNMFCPPKAANLDFRFSINSTTNLRLIAPKYFEIFRSEVKILCHFKAMACVIKVFACKALNIYSVLSGQGYIRRDHEVQRKTGLRGGLSVKDCVASTTKIKSILTFALHGVSTSWQ